MRFEFCNFSLLKPWSVLPYVEDLTYVFELTWSQKLPTFICHFCSQKGCKIYLVGTKLDILSDNVKQRAVELDLITRYSNGIQAKFLETSSKTGENVGKYVYICPWNDSTVSCQTNCTQSINKYLRFCDAPLICFGPLQTIFKAFIYKQIYL